MKKIHYPNRDFVFSQLICIIWDYWYKSKEILSSKVKIISNLYFSKSHKKKGGEGLLIAEKGDKFIGVNILYICHYNLYRFFFSPLRSLHRYTDYFEGRNLLIN